MTTTSSPSRQAPLYQPLDNGLVLRTARHEEDIERLAQFNGVIHGTELVSAVRGLAAHHPYIELGDWFFVENEQTGEVISSLCVIPWTLHYGNVPVQVGEMGLVGTLEAYRRRGLVRVQVDYFMQRLRERGCLLSFIQGIPYYYRQFGYEYALPLGGGVRISGRDLPNLETRPFTFRRATEDDLPILQRLYNEAAADLAVSVARDEAGWRYWLLQPEATILAPEVWVALTEEGEVAGYFAIPTAESQMNLVVGEVSRLTVDAGLAVLRHCRQLAVERSLPAIHLNLPADTTIMRLAQALGGQTTGAYSWQIHVTDLAALLQTVAPVLEERLAHSPFAGMTRDVQFGFFRDAVLLRFVEGRLVEVTEGGPAQGEINFPPLKIIPLIFGHHTIDELRAANPDIYVAGVWRLLLEALFPKAPGFIYRGY
jgi:predicted acetyltransferase